VEHSGKQSKETTRQTVEDKMLYKALTAAPPPIISRIKLSVEKDWSVGWKYLNDLPIAGKMKEIWWRNWFGKAKVMITKTGPVKYTKCKKLATSDHILNKCTRSLTLADMAATMAKIVENNITFNS